MQRMTRNLAPLGLLVTFLWMSSPGVAAATLFDDFDDGDYLINPPWRPYQPDDLPGTIEVVLTDRGDPAFHVIRTGVGGNGGNDGIEMDVDIPVDDTTTLSFDAKAVNWSVALGCGFSCGEYPVSVSLRLERADGSEMTLRYALNYGTAQYPMPILDRDLPDHKQRAFLVPRDEWVSVSFRIRNEWPDAVRLVFIRLVTNGWDYEGFYDNVRICAACPDDPSPESQGFWHRQCLGVPAAEGGIDPGRNGRGPSAPTEPGFNKDLMPVVSDELLDLVFETHGSCAGGMDVAPASDPCEKAVKQLTALLFNRTSGRLGDGCSVDLPDAGSSTLGELIDEVAALINSGDVDNCRLAGDLAAAINEGEGLLESVLLDLVGSSAQPTVQVATRSSGSVSVGTVEMTASDAVESTTGISTVGTGMPILMGSEKAPASPDPAPSGLPAAGADDGLRRHLAVLANPEAPESARQVSRDFVLTALGGGYEPDARLVMVKALLESIDVAFDSLLEAHLADIRDEAVAFGLSDIAREVEAILKLRLGPAE